MEFSVVAESLEGALSTLRGFVHKPGADAALIGVTATHLIADADANTLTFIGNNPSQRVRLELSADVKTAGETLLPVADALTALSTIADKAQKVRVEFDDDAVAIRSKTVSVHVPVLDLERVRVKPRTPVIAKGKALSVTVKADALPAAFARALPGTIESKFDKVMMWVEDGEFCLLGASGLAASFASVSGAKSQGATDLVLWEPSNLKRIVGLASGADTVTITQDSADAALTIAVTSADGTIYVEQTLETVPKNYSEARDLLLGKALPRVINGAVTTITMKAAEVTRAIESAEKVRTIGRDRSTEKTVKFAIGDGLLEVALPNDQFCEELDSAKTEGITDRSLAVNSQLALSLLTSLGSEAKVTLQFPPDDETGKTNFALVTAGDTASKDKGNLPLSGYWGFVSFRLDKK